MNFIANYHQRATLRDFSWWCSLQWLRNFLNKILFPIDFLQPTKIHLWLALSLAMMYKLFIFILLLLLHRIRNLSEERVRVDSSGLSKIYSDTFERRNVIFIELRREREWVRVGGLMPEDFTQKVSVQIADLPSAKYHKH